jgi:hypothetical protein
MLPLRALFLRATALLVCSVPLLATACDTRGATQPSAAVPSAASFGKTGGGGGVTGTSVSVASVNPDSGALSTTLDVSVNGNGFSNGMVAVWQFAGVADPSQIKTNSTRYVSTKQVVANITISGTATSGQWDVAMFAGGKTGVGSEVGVLKNGFRVTDPTTTWTYPLNDAGLGVRSDHLYSDGVHSAYSNGVCSLSTTIFATDAASNSGDATLNTGSHGRCVRHFTFVYPDGYSETLPSFNNLRMLENTTYSITIGATVERQLHMGSDAISNVASRCGGLVWGVGPLGQTAVGSDSVLVTRLDASTWHVASQPPPHNLAWCKTTGQLFAMPVDFTVVSNRPLP